jgi:hypothetical protein
METDHSAGSAKDASGSLSDAELAAFVVDSLLRSGLVAQEHAQLAITLVAEELLVRRLSGELTYP